MEGEKIVINVEVNTNEVAQKIADATKHVKELKDANKDLAQQLKDGTITETEYTKAIAANNAEIQAESRAIKSNTAVLQAANLTTVDTTMSLDEQRQALNTLQKAYGALDGEARKAADAEGGLRSQIAKLSDSVKQQEAAIGDTRRNVGNYAMQTAEATSKMGFFGQGLNKVSVGFKNANMAAKAMAANPIMAVITVLVTLIMKLAERFKQNGAAMESLTKTMGAFNGVGVILEKLIDGIAKGVTWLSDKLFELADSFGLISAEMKESSAIATEELNLQKKQADTAVEIAETQRDISDLRAKANEKDKYSASERLKFLQEANDKEEEIQRKQYENAKAAYELQVRKNAQSESSQEDIKKEQELYIAMVNSETALNEKRRSLNAQMAALRKQEAAESQAALNEQKKQREAAAKEEEERQKKAAELAQAQADTMLEIQHKAEDLRISLIGDEGAKAVEARRVAGTREIEQLQKQLATDKTLTEQSKQALNDLIIAKQSALDSELAKMSEEYAKKQIQEEAERQRQDATTILELKKKLAADGSRELLELDLQLLDLQEQEELSKYEEGSEARLLIEKQFQQARAELEAQYQQQQEETRQAQIDSAMNTAGQIASAMSGALNAISQLETAQLNRYKQDQEQKKKALDKRLQAGEISEEQYAKQVQQLDEETAQKEKELQIQQAKRDKAMNLMNAAINTASAIIGFLANPSGFAGIALSAMAAITGAVQMAAIAAEPIPQFERGGVVPGNSYTGDNVLVRANSGEGIFTKAQQAQLFELANSSTVPAQNYDAMAAAMSEAVAQMPAPVMVYSEFQEFQDEVSTFNEIAKI